MAKPVKWDISGFEKLLKSSKSMQQSYWIFIDEFMSEIGDRTLAKTKKLTPVDTGELRRKWEVSPVRHDGDNIKVDIFNPVEYASHVEDGHAQHRRWVPGYWKPYKGGSKFVYDPQSKTGMMLTEKWIPGNHMGRIAISQIEIELPRRYEKAFQGFLNRIGGIK